MDETFEQFLSGRGYRGSTIIIYNGHLKRILACGGDKSAGALLEYAKTLSRSTRLTMRHAWEQYRLYRRAHQELLPPWPLEYDPDAPEREAFNARAPVLRAIRALARALDCGGGFDAGRLALLSKECYTDNGSGPELNVPTGAPRRAADLPPDCWNIPLSAAGVAAFQELERAAELQGELCDDAPFCDLSADALRTALRRLQDDGGAALAVG